MDDSFDRTGYRTPEEFLHAGYSERKIISKRERFAIDALGNSGN